MLLVSVYAINPVVEFQVKYSTTHNPLGAFQFGLILILFIQSFYAWKK